MVHDGLADAGVEVVDVGSGVTPIKTRVRVGPVTVTRLDRTGDVAASPLPRQLLRWTDAVLVSDYGRGMSDADGLEVASGAGRPLVWDPHPAGAAPIAGTWLATPDQREAAVLSGVAGRGRLAAIDQAPALSRRWHGMPVAVTCGPEGTVFASDPDLLPLVVSVDPLAAGDTCGAGDAFAVAAAVELAFGRVPSDAVVEATAAAGRFVAAGAAGGLHTLGAPAAEVDDPVERTRARHGRIIATGGCFDILHSGHLSLLAGARALGDCLVVCVNSDASARALKGPGRPVRPVEERRLLLEQLESVDRVVVFDEPTPAAALAHIRPDVFVKGGDYSAVSDEEREVMARVGGRVVVLPYVAGRSTTAILEEVRHGR
jgi:rfaE bifunctional protein nucleotidyltransferase chain/domain